MKIETWVERCKADLARAKLVASRFPDAEVDFVDEGWVFVSQAAAECVDSVDHANGQQRWIGFAMPYVTIKRGDTEARVYQANKYGGRHCVPLYSMPRDLEVRVANWAKGCD